MRKTLAVFSVIALPIVSVSAEEVTFPERRAGMWEVKMATDQPGMPETTMQLCIDAASDAEMMQAGMSMSKEMCSSQEMTRSGDSIVIDATCQMGGMKVVSHTVMTGDFQSAYKMEIASDIEGAPAGMPAKSNMTQTGTWLGDACTGGLQPGDMLMPGGMKVNARDMMKMMGGG